MFGHIGYDLLIGIIGNLIAAALLAWLKTRDIAPWLPVLPVPKQPAPSPAQAPNSLSEKQARNRTRLKTFLMYFFFYSWTLITLYFCVSVPIIVKVLLSKVPVYLDSPAYIGVLMPHVQVGLEQFQWPLIMLAMALYLPLLFLSALLMRPVNWLVRPVHTMDTWELQRAQALLFALGALFVSGATIYFYHDMPLEKALLIPLLIFMGIGLAIWAGPQNSKKKSG